MLQAQLQDIFATLADDTIEQLRADLSKNNISIPPETPTRSEPKSVDDAANVEIAIKGIAPAQVADLRRVVSGPAYAQWTLTPVGPSGYRLTVTPAAALEIRRNTMDAVGKALEKRLDALMLASWVEPAPNKGAEVKIQFAPTDDTARIKNLLMTGGVLEMHGVKAGPFGSIEEAEHDSVPPLNSKLVPEALRPGNPRRYWMISSVSIIRGSDLVQADAAQGETRDWDTNFVLSPAAARRFEAYTARNIGNRIAIVVDGQAITVPTIQSTISDRGRISGAKTQQEATDLAMVLKSPLPARLVLLEERTIGSNSEPRTPNPERTK